MMPCRMLGIQRPLRHEFKFVRRCPATPNRLSALPLTDVKCQKATCLQSSGEQLSALSFGAELCRRRHSLAAAWRNRVSNGVAPRRIRKVFVPAASWLSVENTCVPASGPSAAYR